MRASAAAPFFFEPESITIEGREFLFFDGGLTPYNNPAFKLFQMATLPEYRLGWKPGAGHMLLVSVGTGLLPRNLAGETLDTINFLKTLPAAVQALMYTSAVEQDMLCRSFARMIAGDSIDSEVGTLAGTAAIGGCDLFTYARYNADLSAAGLARLGLRYGDDVTFTLENLEAIQACVEIGSRVAEQAVMDEHFDGFWA